MAVLDIAIPTDTAYPQIEVTLDGTVFALDLEWNTRAGVWFMNLYLPTSSARTPILLGQALVAQRPLLLGVTHPDRPLGELYVRAERDPERYSWAREALLVYYDQSEGFGVL